MVGARWVCGPPAVGTLRFPIGNRSRRSGQAHTHMAVARNTVATGSVSLCDALFRAGPVDQVNRWIYPVVQGRGRRLFPDGYELDRRRLFDCRPVRQQRGGAHRYSVLR